jgi:hypothetical protein
LTAANKLSCPQLSLENILIEPLRRFRDARNRCYSSRSESVGSRSKPDMPG